MNKCIFTDIWYIAQLIYMILTIATTDPPHTVSSWVAEPSLDPRFIHSHYPSDIVILDTNLQDTFLDMRQLTMYVDKFTKQHIFSKLS